MIDLMIKNLTGYDVWMFFVYATIILSANWLIKKAAVYAAVRNPALDKRTLPTVDSLVNWLAFYGVIILFLFSFIKTKWLFYPLYSDGDVDVTAFLIITAFLIVSLAHRLVKLFTKYVLTSVYKHYGVDKGLSFTFNQIIYYTVMFAALAISLTRVGLDLTALGAVIGVLGIGIGFGIRNVAGNFVSGIIILFERPIEVGEIIQIDNKIGRVEKIALRSTVIRTAKEGTLIVPNQYFIEQIIKNRTGAEMMAQVLVRAAYGTDSRHVQTLLERAVEKVRGLHSTGMLERPQPDIRFIDFRNNAMEFIVEIRVINFERKEQLESILRHEIVQQFTENKIKVPAIQINEQDR